MRLRIELMAYDGRKAWAEYDNFRLVSNIDKDFKINVNSELRVRTRITVSILEATMSIAQLVTV